MFHKGPLSAPDRKTVDWMKKTANSEESLANCAIRTVDLSGKLSEGVKALWQAQASAKPPWMVVMFPRYSRAAGMRPAWSGPLRMDSARKVLDSPKRRELARRLLAGESAVWLFLESERPKADKATLDALARVLGDATVRAFLGCAKPEAETAHALLVEVLKKMEATLRLPVQQPMYVDPAAEGDEDEQEASLRVGFSILRVSREDPAEQAFVQMLMRTEEDLESDYATDVMAFPVLGRGRALFALVSGGINDDNIQEVCEFTVGPCSCQVKQLNPGTDLLMTVDWDAALERGPVVEQPAPPLPVSVAATGASSGDPATKPGSGEGPSSRPAGAASQPAGLASLKAGKPPEDLPTERTGSVLPIVLWSVGGVVIASVLLGLWAKSRFARP